MRRAMAFAGPAALVVACGLGYEVDQDAFCRGRPDAPSCAAPGGSAGAFGAGGGGAAGDAGQSGGGGTAGLGGGGAGGVGGLVCETPSVDCEGKCVDVKASDAENCGACGRSCRGSTCEAGACRPEALTSVGEVAPYALADDGTYLYWASPARKGGSPTRLRREPKATVGGTGETIFGSVEVRSRSLAFASGKLYFGDLETGGVVSGAPGASFPDAAPFAADQLDVRALAITASKAFWTSGGESAVRGRLLAGGAFSPDLGLQANPGWVAADASASPYWVAGAASEVRRLKAVAPGYEAFATGSAGAGGAGIVSVELAGETVFWADASAGVIRSAPKMATPPAAGAVAFSGHGRVEGFRVDGTTLYVLTLEAGVLKAWRNGPDDEQALLLGKVAAKADGYAGNPFGAAHVLVDAGFVYFADTGTVDTGQVVPGSLGDGAVYRIAK